MGLLGTFWNIPVFSHGPSEPSLADKTIYKTLVRLGPPFNKLGRALVKIFNHFNWHRAILISQRKIEKRGHFCDYSSRATDAEFRSNNITLEWMQIADGLSDEEVDIILTNVQLRSRSKWPNIKAIHHRLRT